MTEIEVVTEGTLILFCGDSKATLSKVTKIDEHGMVTLTDLGRIKGRVSVAEN